MLQYPIFFNHVPKCAGTSLNELFCRGIPKSAVGAPPFGMREELVFASAKRVDDLQFVASHLPHRYGAKRFQDWSKVTVVRQPWARFISATRHVLRLHEGGQSIPAYQSEFVDLLSQGKQKEAIEQALGWYPLNASVASCFIDIPAEQATVGILEETGQKAKSILAQYDLVFLTEKLNDDWGNLERYLEGTVLCSPNRLNSVEGFQKKRTPVFDDSLEPLFESQFPYEYDIYKAAQEVYPECSSRLAQAVEQSQTISQGPAPKVIAAVDWEQPVRCGGLSDRIVAGSFSYKGKIARRLEASQAMVELPIPPVKNARLELVFWLSNIHFRKRCRVGINGTEVACFTAERELTHAVDPHQLWTSAEIPADALESGVLQISFDRSDAPDLHEMWLLDIAVRPML